MTLDQQKEQFSFAYVRAVAAVAQVAVTTPTVDDDSVDLIFKQRGGTGIVKQAMRFLDHARFGMPQRGSYILTIISPVGPRLIQDPAAADGNLADEPFERRTMRTLAEAVHSIELASRQSRTHRPRYVRRGNPAQHHH